MFKPAYNVSIVHYYLFTIINELYGPSLWQAVIRELVRNQREVKRQFWGAKRSARLELAGVSGGRPANIPAASERYWLAEYRNIASAPSGSAPVPAPAVPVLHPAAAPATAAAAGHGSCAPTAAAASASNMPATAAAAATHVGTKAPPASTATATLRAASLAPPKQVLPSHGPPAGPPAAAAACAAAGQGDGGCASIRGETQSPFATLCSHTAVQLRLLLEAVTCKHCTCITAYQDSKATPIMWVSTVPRGAAGTAALQRDAQRPPPAVRQEAVAPVTQERAPPAAAATPVYGSGTRNEPIELE